MLHAFAGKPSPGTGHACPRLAHALSLPTFEWEEEEVAVLVSQAPQCPKGSPVPRGESHLLVLAATRVKP